MIFFWFFLVRFFFKNSIELKQHLIETKNYRINKNKQDTHVIHSYKHTNTTQEGRKLKKNLRTWQKKTLVFRIPNKKNPKNSLCVNSNNNNNNNEFSEFKNSHRNPEMIFFYIYIFGTKKKNKYLPQQTNKQTNKTVTFINNERTKKIHQEIHLIEVNERNKNKQKNKEYSLINRSSNRKKKTGW